MSYFWQETGLSSSPTIPYQEGTDIQVYRPVKDGASFHIQPYLKYMSRRVYIVLGTIFYKKSLET